MLLLDLLCFLRGRGVRGRRYVKVSNDFCDHLLEIWIFTIRGRLAWGPGSTLNVQQSIFKLF